MPVPEPLPPPAAAAGLPALASGSDLPPLTRRTRAWALLLEWYAVAGRAHLPWRHTHDPYAVLVAEIMLQQTQVERVLPKYQEFLAHFPSLAALAAAPVAEVITAWAGLGYNTRAVRLHAIARQAVERYGGGLPLTLSDLLALKGIGRYTAGAVACFALGLPVATVDTNIRRVLWRVFAGVEPCVWPSDATNRHMMLALAEWALPPGAAYGWQQALMDLGATVCLSRRPACERCPLREVCAAVAQAGHLALFPSGESLVQLRDVHARAAGAAAGIRRIAEDGVAYAPRRAQAGVAPLRRRAAGQPFTSTSRYYRGRIVDALRALPPGESLALPVLGTQVKPDFTPDELPWLRALAQALARDGLARLLAPAGSAERLALP